MGDDTAPPIPASAEEEDALDEQDEHNPPVPGEGWAASAWLKGLDLHENVAEAVLQPILAMKPPGLAQYAFCKGLRRHELHQLLHEGRMLDAMEVAIWRGVKTLARTGVATAAELSAKFATESGFELSCE